MTAVLDSKIKSEQADSKPLASLAEASDVIPSDDLSNSIHKGVTLDADENDDVVPDTILFCIYCENMLYQREIENHKIEWYCRNCNYSKGLEDEEKIVVIYEKNYNNDELQYSRFINPYLKHDHTLPHVRNIECKNPKCTKTKNEENDIIYIKYNKDDMKFLYHCVYCEFYWKND